MVHNILIVDDSATMRGLLKRTVKLAQLCDGEMFEAGDGKAALEVLGQQHVDMILADLHMPVMDGAELTRRVLADPRTAGIPLVIVSAEPNTARLEELKALGVRAVVSKPFTPERLRDVVLGITAAVA